jgi:hypothetical protein
MYIETCACMRTHMKIYIYIYVCIYIYIYIYINICLYIRLGFGVPVKSSFIKQIYWLTRREMLNVSRDTTSLLARLVL